MVRDWMSLLLGLGGWAVGGLGVMAQSLIVPDGTLGGERSRLGTVIVNGQPSTIIDSIVGGVRRGQNLFHSFQEFNVAAGRGVYFQNPDAAVQNILARVTGNKNSTIEGTLGTFGPGRVNLFLMNPNGIVFGENASLDVQGAFAATTASAIGFGTAGDFSAINPQRPGDLLAVDPSVFIFASLQKPGSIVVQSQATRSVIGRTTSGLQVRNGQRLMLLGGNVTIDGGSVTAWGGRVDIGSVLEGGTIGFHPNRGLQFIDEVSRGNVLLQSNASIDVRADDLGSITVNARKLEVLDGSRFLAGIFSGLGSETSRAGNVTLNATDEISFNNKSGILNVVESDATGNGGNIEIKANSVSLKNSSQLIAETSGQGNAGKVVINSPHIVSIAGNSSGILNTVSLGAIGNAGDIEVYTGSLFVSGRSQLTSSTNGKGNSGNVKIIATDKVTFDGFESAMFSLVSKKGIGNAGNIEIITPSLSLKNRSQVSASTFGKGDAGNITIEANNAIFIDGIGSTIFSSVQPGGLGNGGKLTIKSPFLLLSNDARLDTANASRGNGGNIDIESNSITLTNGSLIRASTNGNGSAGNIKIIATDAVSLRGVGGDGRTSAILSQVGSEGMGQGGDVEISTRYLSLTNGAQISALTVGQGNAGNITITATDLVALDGLRDYELPSSIITRVVTDGVGNGGKIEVNTGSLLLTNGARLDAITEGQGDAGRIIITARKNVFLDGAEINGFSSGLFTSTGSESTGKGGEIIVSADSFRVSNGALINTSTSNYGVGGSVTVNSNIFEVISGGKIITTTYSTGQAGNIILNVANDITITGSDPNFLTRRNLLGGDLITNEGAVSGLFATTGSQAAGNGGDVIIITGKNFELKDGAQVSTQSRGTGTAGDITVNATKNILTQSKSNILTISDFGDGGNISLNAKTIVALEDSNILAFAPVGKGGNITLNTLAFLSDPLYHPIPPIVDRVALNALLTNGQVDVNASGTTSGAISGVPDTSFIQNSLNQLPKETIDTTKLLANTCIVRKDKPESTFYITGTGGLPNRPGDPSLSNYPTNTVAPTQTATHLWQKGDPIEEPTGFYKLANGRLVMSRECSSESIAQP
jgi:filamentous hemagglutinin family protein